MEQIGYLHAATCVYNSMNGMDCNPQTHNEQVIDRNEITDRESN